MTDEEAEAAVQAAGDKIEGLQIDSMGKYLSRTAESTSVGKRILYSYDLDGVQTGFSVEDV